MYDEIINRSLSNLLQSSTVPATLVFFLNYGEGLLLALREQMNGENIKINS